VKMSAGRRRGWWLRTQHWEEEASKEAEKKEDKDGRLKSQGSKGRVSSERHATPSDRTKI
tara:strand:+ start:251 stop:430 length:180 start_codon:yes stop_codon:yes gene_type:complete